MGKYGMVAFWVSRGVCQAVDRPILSVNNPTESGTSWRTQIKRRESPNEDKSSEK